MILYALACRDGHRFESWFRDSAGYEDQIAQGLVACPVCGVRTVSKAIMAPAIVSRATADRIAAAPPEADVPDVVAPPALLDQRQTETRVALKAIRDRILSEGEDVGDRFPDQARKMHDGDIPHRQIHGQATIEEARALLEDGVAILPVPLLPEGLN